MAEFNSEQLERVKVAADRHAGVPTPDSCASWLRRNGWYVEVSVGRPIHHRGQPEVFWQIWRDEPTPEPAGYTTSVYGAFIAAVLAALDLELSAPGGGSQ
jgi:hypothetical protein